MQITRYSLLAGAVVLAFAARLSAAAPLVLDLGKMTCGVERPMIDRSLTNRVLTIAGTRFEHGVGTHAVSELPVNLDGKGRRFTAKVGVDDAANGAGSVEFQVIGDGRTLWTSGVMRGGQAAKPVDVDLTGVKLLALRVTDGGDGNGNDQADWADFQLVMADGNIQTFTDPYVRIAIATKNLTMRLMVGDDGRLYQEAIDGPEAKGARPDRTLECYPQAGDGYYYEPALAVEHADGNTSTRLLFSKVERRKEAAGGELVRIALHDEAYPLSVTLCYRTWPEWDVIEQWAEITNGEDKPVILSRFASAAPVFDAKDTMLTHWTGGYNDEMVPVTEQLTQGLKILDTKLTVRTQLNSNPSFVLSFDGAPREDAGRVLGGSLAWTGNYQFAFDHTRTHIRALAGINPFAAEYHLDPGATFVAPAMTWAWSDHGLGQMSRNLHRWARSTVLRDGDQPRAILLNNWEATGMDFDFQRIAGLFAPAKAIGTELFLLDDGWFGDKHPRVSDNAGLGDWMPNPRRFPNGMAPLAGEANKLGMRFGIWVEPEMVNPSSDLFEAHPDWVITQPKRSRILFRNQLVLDLTRRAVQDYVWNALDGVMGIPGVSYVKWDCNSIAPQPGSTNLSAERQSNLAIDYTRAFYALCEKAARKYPKIEMMLCSGGGGRVDFAGLRYFHEFWPSDNTDPNRRITMQYQYSTFFPAIAMAAHVTRSGDKPMAFACAVAMSARFGMDLDLAKVSEADKAVLTRAIADYKRVRPVIQLGDLYRIENPSAGPRSVLNYVSADRARAVLFVLQNSAGNPDPARPQGLDPAARYTAHELLPVAGRAPLEIEGKTMTGEALMRDGLVPTCHTGNDATIVELTNAPLEPK
jgi:alpha-galactosidase